MLNPLDENKRGYGSSYNISSNKFLDVFFERKLDSQKINEVLGREITDEEIENLVDHYAVKYILCKNCEDKFERIENYFNITVFKEVFNNKHKQVIINNNQIIHLLENANNNIVRLFILSLIWRASIVKFDNFILNHRDQEQIRKLLNECLDLDINELEKKTIYHQKKIRSYPLMLFSTRFFSDTTSNLVHIDKSTSPYFFKINEYIILLGTKQNQIRFNTNAFYGLSKYINYNESININEETIKITEISGSDFHSIKDEIFTKIGDEFIIQLVTIFTSLYHSFYGNLAPKEIVQNFLDDFIDEDITIAEKYSPGNIKKKISEYLV
ncbi:hypothetical protein B0A67_15695 [Flavobacterium aquidurense]|nr:hypothetical protein B0A67_15695 [Flavobacterium aquidurense]SHH73122.1 hypothetical protein SAMN05444481_12538 [Flavobacterium frigidimaris]